ncbi:ABC transporter related protein [Oscillochloris trichoides DG-6]|uniref:ABC transporter related protein n=1 Tax=Oscillochloris trichoides DG-6 TaxID=765420 RepID=E1IFQ0_9CHLR|nr:ABC transporter related protein [Oscillochloris trichoides DG-6]
MLGVSKSRPKGEGREAGGAVLNQINLHVTSGSFVSIVGPGGCGKSTLLRLLAGLDLPSAGHVLVGGHNVKGPNPRHGIIFQEANLFPWLSVLHNVTFGPLMLGIRHDEAEAKAKHWLNFLGLSRFLHRYPHQLSGGMQQRVAIARAIVNDPDLLLADEPFGGLDWITREQVCDELLRLWHTTRKTFIYVTHALEEAVYMSQRVIVLSSRPATVARSIEINLPDQRWDYPELRFTPEYAHLVEEVRTVFTEQTAAQTGASLL